MFVSSKSPQNPKVLLLKTQMPICMMSNTAKTQMTKDSSRSPGSTYHQEVEPELEYNDFSPEVHLPNVPCQKQDTHKDFIPITDFRKEHLPEGHRSRKSVAFIRAMAKLTFHIRVENVSEKRPEFLPGSTTEWSTLSAFRGKRKFRTGTGYVWKITRCGEDSEECFAEDKIPCICEECKLSSNPKKVWWKVDAATALHVLFDEEEVTDAIAKFFFDHVKSKTFVAKGHSIFNTSDHSRSSYDVDEKIESDLRLFTIIIHDQAIAERLKISCRRYWKHKTAAVTGGPVIVVSHPHGCPKHVSFGQQLSKELLSNGKTFIVHDASTCNGSSGAHVVALGEWWGYNWHHPFQGCIHKGALPDGTKTSGECSGLWTGNVKEAKIRHRFLKSKVGSDDAMSTQRTAIFVSMPCPTEDLPVPMDSARTLSSGGRESTMDVWKTKTSFKIFITAWAFGENLLFSGFKAGWPALVYIFKKEKIYAYLCEEGGNRTLEDPTGQPANQSFVPLVVTQKPTNETYSSQDFPTNHTPGKPITSHINQSASLFFDVMNPLHKNVSLNTTYRDYNASNVTKINSRMTSPEVRFSDDTSSPSHCPEQDVLFNQCFTVATVIMAVSALTFGHLNYKFGIRVPRILSVLLFVVGCLCIAFISEDAPWLMYPGLVLVSSGGMALYLTNNQVSYMYTTGSAAVIGLMCGALEASSFTQSLVKIAYENDIGLKTSYIFIGSLYLLTLISTFFFLPKKYIRNQRKVSLEIEVNEPVDKDFPQSEQLNSQSQEVSHNIMSTKESPPTISALSFPATNTSQSGQTGNPAGASDWTRQPDRKISSSLWRCVFSKTFLIYLFWACVVQLILAMCLGTFNPWVSYITHDDDEKVSTATDVLLYSMLASPVLSLLTGAGLDLIKRTKSIDTNQIKANDLLAAIVSLGATSIFGVITCACLFAMSSDIIVLVCGVIVIFRTGLYSCGTAFLRILYPTQYFGILCGIMSLLAGGFSLVQYPLFLWVQHRDNAWQEVFGFLGILGTVSLVQPCHLAWKRRQVLESSSTRS